MRVALVILTLNEIDGLRALFDDIPLDSVDEVFVMDGGSTDGTREFFEERRVEIVDQASRGRGEAFRIAVRHSESDAFIFFSPDGNEDPSDVPRFRPLLEAGNEIVIASRMMRRSRNEEDDSTLRLRKWVNNAFTIAANLAWNQGNRTITDTINGYRAITRNAFDQLVPVSMGYTIEFETSIRAMKLGLRIAEFPTYEGDRVGGESYAKSLPTGLRMLRTLLSELRTGHRFTPRNR